MKTKVYNLIILDESGSMSCIRQQAIDGVNETFNSIREAQKEHEDQEQFVTFITFDTEHRTAIYDKTPIADTMALTRKDYMPGGGTPLYDTMGYALTNLRQTVTPMDLVLVTVITDGYENASREYSEASIKALVDDLTKNDWVFSYIGANQDVERVATNLGMSNFMEFTEDAAGTEEMFRKERKARSNAFKAFSKLSELFSDSDNGPSEEEVSRCKKGIASGYFSK